MVDGILAQGQYVKDSMFPSADRLHGGRDYFFEQDNAPAPKQRKWFLEQRRVTVMEWPTQSPDLNPNENLWQKLKLKMHNSKPRFWASTETMVTQPGRTSLMSNCPNL